MAWFVREVAEKDGEAFCHMLRKFIIDPASRMKIYKDGPRKSAEYLQTKAQNEGLICALIFAAVYASVFNETISASTQENPLGSSQTAAVVSMLALYISMVSSAIGIGCCSLINILLPLSNGGKRDSLHILCTFTNMFMLVDAIPVVAFVCAIAAAMIWGFVSIRTNLMIACSVTSLTMLACSIYLWVKLVAQASAPCRKFESLISSGNMGEARKLLGNVFDIKWEGS